MNRNVRSGPCVCVVQSERICLTASPFKPSHFNFIHLCTAGSWFEAAARLAYGTGMSRHVTYATAANATVHLFATRKPSSMSCRVLSCPIVSYLIVSYPVLSCRILSYLVVSCLIVSYPVLSYLVLSCLILSYLVVSCRVMPRLSSHIHVLFT